MNKHFYVVFIDETGFMLNPLARRTWSPRGHTPIIKVSENYHDRISVIGAMTVKMVVPRQFGFLFHLSRDNTNFRGHTIVAFLDHIYNRLHARINLVWDSIKIHSAEPVNTFLALHPAMKVFFFPPYAPELNPVDNIWGYIKYNRLANFCPYDLVELRKQVCKELFRIQKKPDLLESLFRHTGLNLDS